MSPMVFDSEYDSMDFLASFLMVLLTHRISFGERGRNIKYFYHPKIDENLVTMISVNPKKLLPT